MKRRVHLLPFVALLLAAAALPGKTQLTWDGQAGVFLNPLAYPVAPGKIEASTHFIDLSHAGSVTTVAVAAGFRHNLDASYSRVMSAVPGVASQNVFSAKWQFLKEQSAVPGAAVWVQYRDLVDDTGVVDYGFTGTKVLKIAKHTVLLDLGLRSSKVSGMGLFDAAHARQLRWEGTAALFATQNFIVGVEFKEQVNGRTWSDVAARWIRSKHLNLDAGLADFAPGLNRQFAVGITWKD